MQNQDNEFNDDEGDKDEIFDKDVEVVKAVTTGRPTIVFINNIFVVYLSL